MAYKYTYPVVDRALRNFLVFVFVLMTVVAVAAAVQITFGVDVTAGGLLSDAQVMGFIGEDFLDEFEISR